MSFLSAAFLLALPLAAAPVALHLLRRRRQQVIAWGAMQFLNDAASDGRRFDQIEEWLLLALRTLAVLALIFALAQPLVRPWAGGEALGHEVVIVVDDSLSTGLRSGGQEAFEAIRERVIELLDQREPSESIQVMMAGGGPRWLTAERVRADAAGKRELISALEGTKPTAAAADMLTCLRVAAMTEGVDDEQVARTVFVVFDGRANGWRLDTPAAWSQLRTVAARADREVRFRAVSVAPGQSDGVNLSITGVTAARRMALAGEPVALRAEVVNASDTDAPATSLDWAFDGKKQGQVLVEPVPAGGARSVEWRAEFAEEGPHEVIATLESDALGLDNVAGVVIEVVEELPVLVVTDDPGVSATETSFLAAALGADEGATDEGGIDWRSPFQPRFVDPRSLAAERLADYQALVVTSINGLPEAEVERIEAFVRDGGGLWLMLGPRIDREQFERVWRRGGAGLCPAELARLERPSDPDSPDAMIHPPEGDHPATRSLSDTERLDIDRVRMRRFHGFRQSAGSELTPLLESGRGQPLALLNAMGRGRVIVQAFPLRPDWTDLAIARSFVVIVQDWLAFLTQPGAARFNLTPREAIEHRIAGSSAPSTAELVDPTGEHVELAAEPLGDEVVFRHVRTRLPGRYELRVGKGDSQRVVPYWVDRDPDESRLRAMTGAEQAVLTQNAGVSFDAGAVEQVKAVAATRPRLDPAWSTLLVAMVGLMAGESLLATRLSRARYGQKSA